MADGNGIVNIRGKEYETVAHRVMRFREKHPDYGIVTSIVARTADEVAVCASIVGPGGFVLATGHAEESRASSQINRTSALENCETSAIGRALAAYGYLGTEFASADEVAQAVSQQAPPRNEAPRQRTAPAQAARQAVQRAGGKPSSGLVVPFGRDRDVPIEEASDSTLSWVCGALGKSIDDPAKERWRDSNIALRDAIVAEQERRASGAVSEPGAPDDGPPPHEDDDIPF